MKKGRVILGGGSGYCGKLLAEHLAPLGYEPVVLTRRLSEVPAGTRAVLWDGKSLGAWVSELDGAAAVINLSGRSINCRYTESNKKMILQSRLESTRVIGQAIAQCRRPPPVWMNASAVTIYPQAWSGTLGESSPRASAADARKEFLVEVALAWEKALDDAATPATRKIALRTSMILGPESGTVFRILRRVARFGLGGAMGNGRQLECWMHRDDYARAAAWLLEKEELHGGINFAAPQPLPNAAMMRVFRHQLHQPIGLPAAKWMLEIGAFFLRTETQLLLSSRPVVPDRLLASGFQFNFPNLEKAVADLDEKVRKK